LFALLCLSALVVTAAAAQATRRDRSAIAPVHPPRPAHERPYGSHMPLWAHH
jgi:hypothetical protein